MHELSPNVWRRDEAMHMRQPDAQRAAETAAAGRNLLQFALGEFDQQPQVQQNGESDLAAIDCLIFVGDVNARLRADESSLEVRRSAVQLLRHTKAPDQLLRLDELRAWRETGAAFARADGWEEGTITFAPSYKLDPKSQNHYDEQRLPGWCDRILWRKGKSTHIRLLKYDSAPLYASGMDHAPVWASFEVRPLGVDSKEIALSKIVAEVICSDGVWRLGSIDEKRLAAGGTFDLRIVCPRANRSCDEVWVNTYEREKTWRSLLAPVDLEIYSNSAGKWCLGMRLNRPDLQLPAGHFLARYRLQNGKWSEKTMLEAGKGSSWHSVNAISNSTSARWFD